MLSRLKCTWMMDDSEFQVLGLRKNDFSLTLVNYYSPQDKILSVDKIPTDDTNLITVGDFNSHSQSWGYTHIVNQGDEVETWQDDGKLILINKPDDQPTFYSRRWHTTTTPDLAFCSDDLHGHTTRKVSEQLDSSDHCQIQITLDQSISPASSAPRWNYKKADWTLYASESDNL